MCVREIRREGEREISERERVCVLNQSEGGWGEGESPTSYLQAWLEYLFGICSPDRRNGKQGNRYGIPLNSNKLTCPRFVNIQARKEQGTRRQQHWPKSSTK